MVVSCIKLHLVIFCYDVIIYGCISSGGGGRGNGTDHGQVILSAIGLFSCGKNVEA